MNIKYKLLFTTVGLIILLFGCGKKSEQNNYANVNKLVVYGDPEMFVKDTVKNKNSFINTQNVFEFQNYNISNVNFFIENTNSINISNTGFSGTYSLVKFDDNNYFYESNKKESIRFSFSVNKDGFLDLHAVQLSNQKNFANVKPIHYSINSDKSRFSILFSSNEITNSKILIAAEFSKIPYESSIDMKINTDPPYKTMSKDYVSLMGAGIVTSWKLSTEKKVKISVCPSVINALVDIHKKSYYNSLFNTSEIERAKSQVNNSILAWTAPFKSQKLNFDIQIEYPKSCYPFSDVNLNSIHWISEYLTLPNETLMNTGRTFSSFTNDGTIYSSFIFLFGSEINKLDEIAKTSRDLPEIKIDSASIAIIHEMGHFLGLNDKLDEYSSVMSYNSNAVLDEYDSKSILNLYYNQVVDIKTDSDANANSIYKNPLNYKPLTSQNNKPEN